jgi:hypothetical protein
MIVARTFSTTPDTALVNNAVNMAVAKQKPLWLNDRARRPRHAIHILELR